MSALVYENVEKSFGGVHALSDLNIRFETGRIYSIIGPNGAGKSTAVNLAAGSYRASAGRIRLGETDITDLPKHRIAQLGLARTYQNIRLFDEMTVVENLEVAWAWREVGSIWREVLFPRFRDHRVRSRRDTIDRVLESVGLHSLAEQMAGSLAYGQQKRAEIARALVGDPRVLMLDEPAAGLNPAESAELQTLLTRFRSPDRTLVIIEHDMELVMAVSDWIYVLHQGRLLKAGTPDEIKQDAAVQEAYLGTVAESEQLRHAAVHLPTRVRIRAQADLVRHRY